MAATDAARLRAIEQRRRAIDRRRAKLRAELERIEAERAELVWQMHHVEGLSHSAIAGRLGVTKGRVQQLVRQAEAAG